jgi:hypothetical protein
MNQALYAHMNNKRKMKKKKEGVKGLVHAQGSLIGVELGWSLSGSKGNPVKGQECLLGMAPFSKQ